MDFGDEYLEYGEDNFEDQFQDELDALRELEEEEESSRQTHKRKLEFVSPPKNNERNTATSTSEPEPCSKKPKIQDTPVRKSPIPSRISIEEPDTPPIIPIPTRKILKSRTFSIDSFPVTGFDGTCVYLPFKKDADLEIIPKRSGCLLDIPYLTLLDQAERERERKLLKCNGGVYPTDSNNDVSLQFDDETKENDTQETEKKLLWVEKFKPRTYTELLSDDGVNRSLLVWLKKWDKVVFGREVSTKLLQRPKPAFKKDNFPQNEQQETLDDLHRPFYKVAMLCGPPGLGKTTLAFIVAKHAGYNVVEMNASDDRSPEIFKKQLEASTQMRAVMGNDPRPNCLIIDEIDGAPTPAITTLVNFIKATRVGKKKTPVLLRPIICICNDLYAASLRPLRQLALILTFPQTDSARLASRLTSIAHMENTKTDRNAMLALCKKTDNDIRSCLSTLQFLRNTTKNKIRVQDIQLSDIGQKDIQQSRFNIWQCIFQIPKPVKKMSSIVTTENFDPKKNDVTTITGRFYNVLRTVQSYGEYEKIMQGVFENYLQMNFKDPLMENIFVGTDAFCDLDLIQSRISQTQNYSLMPYMPYCIVKSHFMFSCINPSKLAFPSALQECKNRQNQITNIVASLTNYVSPMVRSFNNFESLILQLLPYLPMLIQPTLRPINTQLFSEREKAELNQVIKVMLAYNLTYRQERSVDGLYNYVLEPNIEEATVFNGSKPKYSLTYAIKNIITRELEMEKMRRSEGTVTKVQDTVREIGKDEKVVPNFQKKLQPKQIEVKETDTKDFFGRKIEKIVNDSEMEIEKEKEAQQQVWFCFKEGYTNAVRRKINVKAFM